MKKFIVKTVLLTLPITIILFSMEVYTNVILCNNLFYKFTSCYNILILGNSHSECSLNDSLIARSINFSQSGESYFYTYYKLKKLKEANRNIDTLILEYTNTVLSPEMDNWIWGEQFMGIKYPKYSQLITTEDKLFLFLKNPTVFLISFKDALIRKCKFLTNCKLLTNSDIHLYNQLSWGGYNFLVRDRIPLLKKELQDSITVNKKNTPKLISDINIAYLKKIVNFCKENKIRLILFRSPLHNLCERDYELELTNLLKSDFINIPFWDYGNYTIEDSGFGDLEHLNHKGAKIFSHQIKYRLN